MVEARVPGRYNRVGQTRNEFGFDLKPDGSGGDQNPGIRRLDYPGKRSFYMSSVSYASQYILKHLKSAENGSFPLSFRAEYSCL